MSEPEVKLRQVFDSFDTDKSGFIELSQLRNLAQQLGAPLPEDKIEKIVQKLDTNKDGKISFEEFQYWWKNGHQGELGNLVFLKAKANRLVQKFQASMNQSGVDLNKLSDSKQINQYKIELTLGEAEKKPMGIKALVYNNSVQSVAAIAKLQRQVKSLVPDNFNFVLVLKSDQSESAKAALVDMLNNFLKQEFMPIKVNNLQQNSLVNFRAESTKQSILIHIELKEQLLSMLDQPLGQFDNINGTLGQQSYINFVCRIATNFGITQLLQEQNIVQTLLKGLSLQASVQVPLKMTKKLREIYETYADGQEQPILILLKLLLNKGRFKLKLRSPQMVEKFYQKLGIKQILSDLPSLSELLSQLSMFPQVKQMKNNTASPFHLIYRVLKFAREYIRQQITINVQRKQFIAQFSIKCSNAGQIYQHVFNQF